MPIADVELMMMALAAVLAAQRWLGRPPNHRPYLESVESGIPSGPPQTPAPTTGVRGGGGLLGGANSVFPTPATIINCLGTALDNLTLTAANNTTDLQQLKAAKLVLITSNAMLTVANKKLSEALAKALATMLGMPREIRPNNKPFLGNYC
jgi:hypothetical protein